MAARRKKSARKKSARKKSARKKTARKRGASKGGGTLKSRLAAATTGVSYEQVSLTLTTAFGQGCGRPFQEEVIDAAITRYEANVKRRVADGTFDQPGVLNAAKRCCVAAGQIATSLAEAKKHPEIEKKDFIAACILLEAEIGGGQGAVCG